MTSANVSQMTVEMSLQANASAKSGKEETVKTEFFNLFCNAASNVQAVQTEKKETISAVDSDSSKVQYGQYSAKINKSGSIDAEEVSKQLKEFEEQASEQIQESLGITEEQLEEAMSELGLTFINLLEPSNLAALSMKLTGSEDSLSLIMNADFQGLMQSMETLGENLLQELGVTLEELNTIVEQMQGETQEQVSKDFGEVLNVNDTQETNTAPIQQEALTEAVNENLKQADSKTENVIATTEVTEDAVEENAVDTLKTKQLVGESNEDTQEEGSEEQSKFQSIKFQPAKEEVQTGKEEHMATMLNPEKTAGTPVVAEQSIQQPMIDSTDILEQITDFTKVMYQENVTTMEMQLNPENLGKLYIQVSSKEGVVTAQLATQNEVAKEAIESQVAALKENLNQQGIKVEAVEVTIASHEFERNLEENQQNRGEEEQREQTSKNTRRSLSMDSLDELSGLMSEEEVLAAKIMRDNGNSIDFTA